MWANKAIRQRDRDEAVIEPDFSTLRMIPREEAEKQAELRMQMKQEAEMLRQEKVIA